jgi:signal transduction histidine kinase
MLLVFSRKLNLLCERVMWTRLTLRHRIFLLLAALVVVTLAGGLITIWHTRGTDALFANLVDKNLASLRAAAALENSLLQQKGFLTYFFLDSNPDWLEKLRLHHDKFQQALKEARNFDSNEIMQDILSQIDSSYQEFYLLREGVIGLYQAGRREEGARAHQELRRRFAAIQELCQRYRVVHEYAISRARSESQTRAHFVNTLAFSAVIGVVGLGLLLLYVLIRQVLEPIRRLAAETGPGQEINPVGDEVAALSQRVHTLMEDVDQAQSELVRSQETLLQTEKLALVGKLAAGVAHSIRNPLTSVKMRLFSLQRTLDLNPTQKEDLEVISEEIRHIDTIVRHFLEFSRPPKLKMQRLSLSEVVDRTLTLLRQRLESYGVKVELYRQGRLPETLGDPEQLQEVLVNLILNACEAMGRGGVITIRETRGQAASVGPVAMVSVSDTGPGIPPSIRDKIFQPFFSTKEEGTGLGLSLASRIVQEHGGWITLESRKGAGANFIITLPLRDEDYGNNPHSG